MTTRQNVVAEARTWLRTPYHHQGRIKGVGVDCAMLLCEVYEAVGLIPHVDPSPYPQDWHFHREEERYLGWITKYAQETSIPLPGDVALFQFGRCVSHGAIVVAWPTIIHSYFREGVTVANAEQGALRGRLRKVYTLFSEESIK